MIGVPMGRRVKSENVPFIVFAAHQAAADFTVPRSRRARLHKENRFDIRLEWVVLEAVEHHRCRVPPARSAGAVVEGQQKTHRRLSLQTCFGLRRHVYRRGDTTGQTEKNERRRKQLESGCHVCLERERCRHVVDWQRPSPFLAPDRTVRAEVG